MGGAGVFGAQRGKNLLCGVAPCDGQDQRNETAFAEFDVGVDWLRQGIDRQSILPLRSSGYYMRRNFHLTPP